ncbi:MAG TPA: OmpA family protein [Steroidobacteraceae bacterium]|jgi:OOP family OmpA-OmpF porin|nr:OmpA family protein [Steroidobacteraceae bacterium]
MKRLIASSLVVSISAVALPAVAADDAPSWYVNPMLQYRLDNGDPRVKDDFGYEAGVGVNLPHEWALEADFSRGTFDIKRTDGTRRLDAYTIDVIKKFFPADLMERTRLQPYALAGGGELNDRSDLPGFRPAMFHTFTAEAGLGLLTGIGRQDGSTRVQLRTEAKYRMEWANPDRFGVKDPSGLMFGVGVQMNFGAPDDRPPVVHEQVKEVVREVQAPAPPPPPPPPPAPPPPKGEVRLQGVTFATNSAELTPESDTVLDTTIASLKSYPNLVIEVRGYTDSRGSAEYNLKLSQRRAESVMRYMQSRGLSNQITAKGFGKEDPIADNATKDGQLANRRVVLEITGGNRGG